MAASNRTNPFLLLPKEYSAIAYKTCLHFCYLKAEELNVEEVINAVKKAGGLEDLFTQPAKVEESPDTTTPETKQEINQPLYSSEGARVLGIMRRHILSKTHPDRNSANVEQYKQYNAQTEYLLLYCKNHEDLLKTSQASLKENSTQLPFSANVQSQPQSGDDSYTYIPDPGHSSLTAAQIRNKKSEWFIEITNKYDFIYFWLEKIISDPTQGFALDGRYERENGVKPLNLLLAVFSVEESGYKPKGGKRIPAWSFLHEDTMTLEKYKSLVDKLLKVFKGCIQNRPTILDDFIEGFQSLIEEGSRTSKAFKITKEQVDLIKEIMEQVNNTPRALQFSKLLETAKKLCLEYTSPVVNKPAQFVPPQSPVYSTKSVSEQPSAEEVGSAQKRRKVMFVPQQRSFFFSPPTQTLPPVVSQINENERIDPSTNPKVVFYIPNDDDLSAAESYMTAEMSKDTSLHGIIYLQPANKIENQQFFTPIIFHRKTINCLESIELQLQGRTMFAKHESKLLEALAKAFLKQLWAAQVSQPININQPSRFGKS